MADQLLGSCGPVQTFKYNASAKIISAKLYQRTDGTRYIAVEWSANGCFTFHEKECPGPGYSCDLTVIAKASWDGQFRRHEYRYPGTSTQAGSANLIVSSSATVAALSPASATQAGSANLIVSSPSPPPSYTVEVTTQAKCYCISGVPILTEEATCSCVIAP